ncbi:SRPBCC domain-containing protein [Caulobacter sp. KR2-114]|uniref:SRPBCC domain-containing protein n=1 Tax=Caulobacter sp. KR2-114 TaxID=3400912 RepID=UPI003C02FE03
MTEHREFTLQRRYGRPRAEVWAAWADPALKAAWFSRGEHSLDFRVGGEERGVSHDAMGEHVNAGRYFEIDPGRRIVLAYSMALNGRVHTVSLTTIVLEDDGEAGTRLTFTEQMCVMPPSDGAPGRQQGWGVLLDRLGETLAR